MSSGRTTDTRRQATYADRVASGKRVITVEVPEELHAALGIQSIFEERSQAAIVRRALRDYLRVHPAS